MGQNYIYNFEPLLKVNKISFSKLILCSEIEDDLSACGVVLVQAYSTIIKNR